MKVTMFTMPGCGPCKATQHALTSRGVPFDLIDMEADPNAKARVTSLGYRSAPVVMVDGCGEPEHWSGFQVDRITDLAARVRMQEVEA